VRVLFFELQLSGALGNTTAKGEAASGKQQRGNQPDRERRRCYCLLAISPNVRRHYAQMMATTSELK
jgi:hypothetical protein